MAFEQLKIAMLSVHSCPVGNPGAKDTGGMNVYLRELAQEMGVQGLAVDIYTRVHDPNDAPIVTLGDNVRLIHLKAGEYSFIHKLAIYPHLPEFACNVENFRRLNGLRYNLVFSHYWLSGGAGNYLAPWWHVPHMMMFHTLGAVKNMVGIGEAEPELRIETEKSLARSCHRIIAATKNEKDDLVQHYDTSAERISVIPCGVNVGQFKPLDREKAKQQLGLNGDKVILFVGRIEPLKGIAQLIKALAYLKNAYRLRLLIVGDVDGNQYEMRKLQDLSQELQVANLVTFSGLIKHEALNLFYNAADVCVIPSYYESFGLVALEALACGTPVVANNVGDLQSIIQPGKTGYVVSENTPRALSAKIGLLLTKTNFDRQNRVSTRASVTRFRWSNIAQEMISVFQEVITEHSTQNVHLLSTSS